MEWKYVKPLKNMNSITQIECKYKVQIPQALKNMIIKYNGGRPEKRLFYTDKHTEKVMKSLLSYNTEDKENIYFFSEIFEKGFIPFAITEFGDTICINNQNKNVELYLHETDSFEYICKDVEDFINILY